MFGRDSWSSWTGYTPVFSAGTGTIGDGATSGLWRRMGDSLEVMAELVVGAGTTFQPGQLLSLSMPNGYARRAGDILATTSRVQGTAFFFDDSNHANDRSGITQVPASGTVLRATPDRTNIVILTEASDTVPFTWAAGDRLVIHGIVPVEGF